MPVTPREGRPFLDHGICRWPARSIRTPPGSTCATRLKLFLRVCDGVAHAHRRLIIHRDLKPSNILVDASGQPKLLDFGIAKLLDDTGPRKPSNRLLTPATPAPSNSQAPRKPPPPISIRLASCSINCSPAIAAPAVSATRNSAPAQPAESEVPTDIDFIVAKGPSPRARRPLSSVDEFAADIRAALDWRPVQARSGDRWYRARRFLRRYWLPLAAVRRRARQPLHRPLHRQPRTPGRRAPLSSRCANWPTSFSKSILRSPNCPAAPKPASSLSIRRAITFSA